MAIEKKPQVARHGLEAGGQGIVAAPGNSASRDAGAKNGTVKFNTEERALEVKFGNDWAKLVGFSHEVNNVTMPMVLKANAVNAVALGDTGTLQLPTDARNGDKIAMFDADGEFAANPVMIDPQTEKLNAVTGPKEYKTDNICVIFTYLTGYGWSEVIANGSGGTALNYVGENEPTGDNEVSEPNTIQIFKTLPDINSIDLPSSPELGDRVMFIDKDGMFTVRPLAVSGNGNNINGEAGPLSLNQANDRAEFVYLGDSGWRAIHSNPATMVTELHAGGSGNYNVNLNTNAVFNVGANTEFETTMPTGAKEGDKIHFFMTNLACVGEGHFKINVPAGIAINDILGEAFYIERPKSSALFEFINGGWRVAYEQAQSFEAGNTDMNGPLLKAPGKYQAIATANMPQGISSGAKVYMDVDRPNSFSRNEINDTASQRMKQTAFFPFFNRTFERTAYGTTFEAWAQITPVKQVTHTIATPAVEANTFNYLSTSAALVVTLPTGVLGDKITLGTVDAPGSVSVTSAEDINGSAADHVLDPLTRLISFEFIPAVGWVITNQVKLPLDTSIALETVTTATNATMMSNTHYGVSVARDDSFVLTAPSAPEEGDELVISLVGETGFAGVITIDGDGKELDGSLLPKKLRTPNTTLTLRFVNGGWVTTSKETTALTKQSAVNLDSVDFSRDGRYYVTVTGALPEGVPSGTEALITTETVNAYDGTWHSDDISQQVVRQTVLLPTLRRKLVRNITDTDETSGLVTAEAWANEAALIQGIDTGANATVKANTTTRLTASPVTVTMEKGIIGDKVELVFAPGTVGATLKYVADDISGASSDYALPDDLMSASLEYFGSDGWVIKNLAGVGSGGGSNIVNVQHGTATDATVIANSHNVISIGAPEDITLTLPADAEDGNDVYFSTVNDSGIAGTIAIAPGTAGFNGVNASITMGGANACLHVRYVNSTWLIVSKETIRFSSELQVDLNDAMYANSGRYHVTVQTNMPVGIAVDDVALITTVTANDYDLSVDDVTAAYPAQQSLYLPVQNRTFTRNVLTVDPLTETVTATEWTNVTPMAPLTISTGGGSTIDPNVHVVIEPNTYTLGINPGAQGDRVGIQKPEAGNLTVGATGGQTIGGTASYNVPYGLTYIELVCIDGTDWKLITEVGVGKVGVGGQYTNNQTAKTNAVNYISRPADEDVVVFLPSGRSGDTVDFILIGTTATGEGSVEIRPLATGKVDDGVNKSTFLHGAGGTMSFRCIDGLDWVTVSITETYGDLGTVDLNDSVLLKPGRFSATISTGKPGGMLVADSVAHITTDSLVDFYGAKHVVSAAKPVKQVVYFPTYKREFTRYVDDATGTTAMFQQTTPIKLDTVNVASNSKTSVVNSIEYPTAATSSRIMPNAPVEGDRIIVHKKDKVITFVYNSLSGNIDFKAANYVALGWVETIEFKFSAVSGWMIDKIIGTPMPTTSTITTNNVIAEANSVNVVDRGTDADTRVFLPVGKPGDIVDFIVEAGTHSGNGSLRVSVGVGGNLNGIDNSEHWFESPGGVVSFRCTAPDVWITVSEQRQVHHVGSVTAASSFLTKQGTFRASITAGLPFGIALPASATIMSVPSSDDRTAEVTPTVAGPFMQKFYFPDIKREFVRYATSVYSNDQLVQTTPIVRDVLNLGSASKNMVSNTIEAPTAAFMFRFMPDLAVEGDKVIVEKPGSTIHFKQSTTAPVDINYIDDEYVADDTISRIEFTFSELVGWTISNVVKGDSGSSGDPAPVTLTSGATLALNSDNFINIGLNDQETFTLPDGQNEAWVRITAISPTNTGTGSIRVSPASGDRIGNQIGSVFLTKPGESALFVFRSNSWIRVTKSDTKINRGSMTIDDPRLLKPGRYSFTIADPRPAGVPVAEPMFCTTETISTFRDESFTVNAFFQARQVFTLPKSGRTFERYTDGNAFPEWTQITGLTKAASADATSDLVANTRHQVTATGAAVRRLPAEGMAGDKFVIYPNDSAPTNSLIIEALGGVNAIEGVVGSFAVPSTWTSLTVVFDTVSGWVIESCTNNLEGDGGTTLGRLTATGNATLSKDNLTTFNPLTSGVTSTLTLPAEAGMENGETVKLLLGGNTPLDGLYVKIVSPDVPFFGPTKEMYLNGKYTYAEFTFLNPTDGWAVSSLYERNVPIESRTADSNELKYPGERVVTLIDAPMETVSDQQALYKIEGLNSINGSLDSVRVKQDIYFPDTGRTFTRFARRESDISEWLQTTPLSRNLLSPAATSITLVPNQHVFVENTGFFSAALPANAWQGDRIRVTTGPGASSRFTLLTGSGGDIIEGRAEDWVTHRGSQTFEMVFDKDKGWSKTIDNAPRLITETVRHTSSSFTLVPNKINDIDSNAVTAPTVKLPDPGDAMAGDVLIVTLQGNYLPLINTLIDNNGNLVNGNANTELRLTGDNVTLNLLFNSTMGWVITSSSEPKRTASFFNPFPTSPWFAGPGKLKLLMPNGQPEGIEDDSLALVEVKDSYSHGLVTDDNSQLLEVIFPTYNRTFKIWRNPTNNALSEWTQTTGMRVSTQNRATQTLTLISNEIHEIGVTSEFAYRNLPAAGDSVIGDKIEIRPRDPKLSFFKISIGLNGNTLVNESFTDYIVPSGTSVIEFECVGETDWRISKLVSARPESQVMVITAVTNQIVRLAASRTIIELVGPLVGQIRIPSDSLHPGDLVTLNANDNVNVSIANTDMVDEAGVVQPAPNSFVGKGKLNMYVNNDNRLVYLSAVVL